MNITQRKISDAGLLLALIIAVLFVLYIGSFELFSNKVAIASFWKGLFTLLPKIEWPLLVVLVIFLAPDKLYWAT
jgi:hypothetical protein